MKVLRKQRWLFIWALLALALQLAWAAGHVHRHHAGDGDLLVATFDASHSTANPEHAHDEDASHGSHSDEDHPQHHSDCPTCWTKALASALALPVFPLIALRRPLGHISTPAQAAVLPTFSTPQSFHARAPPRRMS